jgi:hypothetical protein
MSNPEFDRAYAALLDLFPIDPPDPVAIERQAEWSYLVSDMRAFSQKHGKDALLAVIAEAFERIQ